MKILLVDDAKAVQLLMSVRLSSYGYEVVHAMNGKEAVEVFAASAPDLVLMDVEMPVMNGFEASSRIRAFEATQQWAWTPIIFLTSSDTVENLVTAIEAGGDDFMSKSVAEPVLNAKMKAMSRIADLRRRLSAANQRLHDLASRDGLTGLCNRRSMDTRTDQLWAESCQHQRPFGLLMLDIDNFKKYNDHYGHQAGDECLRQVARTLEAVVDQTARSGGLESIFAARYGGEEFAVVAPGVSATGLQDLAERIVQAVHACGIEHALNPPWCRITASVGGHHEPRAQGEVVAMFRAADACLYQAKRAGRNRVCAAECPLASEPA